MEIKYRQILPLISAYAVILAVCYQGTFWRSFGINILEYAQISDLVAMTVMPFVYSMIASIASMFLYPLISSISVSSLKLWGKDVPPRILQVIVFIAFFSTWILVGFAFAGMLLLVIIMWALAAGGFDLETLLMSELTPGTLVFVLTFLLFISISQGNIAADRIIDGTRYATVQLDGTRYRYIGRVSEHIFLLANDQSSVTVVSGDGLGRLALEFEDGIPGNDSLLERLMQDE